MRVVVDPAAPVPPFEQIRQQIESLVVAGELPADARLPSIRQLAADLGLAPGTVARAYADLERSGLVVSARSRGTRVAGGVAVEQAVRRAADDYIAAARAGGLDLGAMVAVLRARHG